MASVTFKIIYRKLMGKHLPVPLYSANGYSACEYRDMYSYAASLKNLRVLPIPDIICNVQCIFGAGTHLHENTKKGTQYSNSLTSQKKPVSGQSNDMLPVLRPDYSVCTEEHERAKKLERSTMERATYKILQHIVVFRICTRKR